MKPERKWERQCRRCGRCCYHKIEYRGQVYYTDVACKYLDEHSGVCTIYTRRTRLNPECAILTPELVCAGILPDVCAYIDYVEGGRGTSRHISELPSSLQRRFLNLIGR